MKKKYLDIILITILSLLFSLFTTWDASVKFDVIKFGVCFFVIEFVFYFLWKKLSTFELKNPTSKILKREFFVYALVIIVPLIISVIAYYPAFATFDTVDQWNQVQTGIYNNWHPVMHTLLFIKIPTMIHNSMLSVSIYHCVFIFAILMYFSYCCRKNYLDFKQTTLALVLITFNPLFIKYAVNILKDIPYSWSVFLTTLFLINISKSDGEWLKNHINKVFFILSSLGILFLRHNGIVPFALMFIALIIFYPKIRKFFAITFISILVGNYIITGPIYELAGINGKNGGRAEMVGVVMGNLSYYYNNSAEFTDNEKELLFTISPERNWKLYYNPKNFNHIKYSYPNFTGLVEENFEDIIKLWFKKTIQNPDLFIQSWLNVTSSIWQMKANISDIDYSIKNLETEITKKGELRIISNKVLEEVVEYNVLVTSSPLKWLFADFGEGLFLIICALAIVIKKTRFNLRKCIPFIPVVINTLVIMLLITGEEYRFIYSQTLCAIPLLLYSLSIKKVDVDSNEKESKISKLYHKYFLEKTDNTLIQFIRYLFVGGLAAIVNIGSLYIFTDVFHIYYLFSNVIAFILGLVVNYILSKKFVFQDNVKYSRSKEFLIYALIGVIGLFLDTLIMGIMTSTFKIYYMLSKIISTLLVFVWNFVARKIFYKVIK